VRKVKSKSKGGGHKHFFETFNGERMCGCGKVKNLKDKGKKKNDYNDRKNRAKINNNRKREIRRH